MSKGAAFDAFSIMGGPVEKHEAGSAVAQGDAARGKLQEQALGLMGAKAADTSDKQQKSVEAQFASVLSAEFPLDANKSVSQLVSDGSLKKSKDAVDNPQFADKLPDGKTPEISVQFTGEKDSKPDFLVKKDGTIEVLNDPEKHPRTKVVVHVERDSGTVGDPTAEQQKSVDKLVDYLGSRVAQKHPENKGKVIINDDQALVSDEVEKRFGSGPLAQKPDRAVPENVQNISDSMNRLRGSNGGGMTVPRGDVDSEVPQRNVPRATDETNNIVAIKDLVASLNGADRQHPYESARPMSDGTYRVGRYGFNTELLGNFFLDLLADCDDPEAIAQLGKPPDPKKLGKVLKNSPKMKKHLQTKMAALEKQGKLPQGFGEKFDGDKVAGLLEKMQGGKGAVTAGELNSSLPKELQEVIAQDRIQKFAGTVGQDPGKIAVAMALGHAPNQQELADPETRRYQTAADNMYHLTMARQEGPGDIDLREANGKILATAHENVGEQLWKQTKYRNSVENGNLGCAASVSKCLQEAGYKYADSAGVRGLVSQLEKNGWKRYPISERRPNDVVFGLEPNRSVSGSAHIGIVGQNDTVYDNNSATTLWTHHDINKSTFKPNNNKRFGNNLWVLRPPESDSATA